MSGPAPLGPGAPPRQRLDAFGVATVRYQIRYLDLCLAAGTDAANRCLVPARALRVNHVSTLLRLGGVDGDVEPLAQALVNYLDPILLNHLYTQRGMPQARIEDGWRDLVRRILGPAVCPSKDV
jgi:hypothetical protein